VACYEKGLKIARETGARGEVVVLEKRMREVAASEGAHAVAKAAMEG
jgi:hypothetical protein